MNCAVERHVKTTAPGRRPVRLHGVEARNALDTINQNCCLKQAYEANTPCVILQPLTGR